MVRIAGARWSIDPGFGCVDLQGTEWARMGQLQWCPTLAQMMSQEVVWPGVMQRDKVLAEINKVAGRNDNPQTPPRSGPARQARGGHRQRRRQRKKVRARLP
jgi:hypothetical protein